MALGRHHLLNLGFQASELGPYLQSRPGFENDVDISTLSPWQETLWLACCPMSNVVETSVAQEATPMLVGLIGHKHTL